MDVGDAADSAVETAVDPSGATARAQELRASLGSRREAESLLAEASRMRQTAAADADAIVEEAQTLAAQLVAESRASAELLGATAQERAEVILAEAQSQARTVTEEARAAADDMHAQARNDVDAHRRRLHAQVSEQVTQEVTERGRRELAAIREESHTLIGDLEASVRILGVSLEAAASSIGELLGGLERLRAHAVDSLPSLVGPDGGPPEPDPPVVPPPPMFTNPAPTTAVPPSPSVFSDSEGELPAPGPGTTAVTELLRGWVDDDDDPPPRTATEAYLRATRLEARAWEEPRHARADVATGQAEDAPDVVDNVRELREAEPGVGAGAGGEDDNAAGRPLGWLFRSPQ